jgi:hypothetical protein
MLGLEYGVAPLFFDSPFQVCENRTPRHRTSSAPSLPVQLYQRIEHLLGRKLDAYPANEEAAVMLATRVAEAQRLAAMDLRDAEDGDEGGGGGRHHRRAGSGPEGEADGGRDDVASALAAEAASGKRRRAMGKGVSEKARGLKLGRRS